MTWLQIFKKFNLTHLWKDWVYRLDWRKPNYDSVKHFLQTQVYRAQELVETGKLPKFKGTRDRRMLDILHWVHAYLTYEIDKKRFGVAEKWQTVNETLNFKRGDCEDGAILIYSLARANGISPGQLKLVAGSVTGGGHCWVEYFPDEFYVNSDDIFDKNKWYTLDWCYWYDGREFSKRLSKDKTKYLRPWFEVTDFII